MPDRDSVVLRENRQRRRWWRFVAALSVSTLTFFTLLSFVDPTQMISRLDELQPAWMLMACLFAGAGVVLRGWRLQLLGSHDDAIWPRSGWLQVAALHQLLFSTLPSGLGDASFPLLVKRCCGLSVPAGIRLVAVYRLQDACVLVGLFGIASIHLATHQPVGSLRLATGMVAAWVALVCSDSLASAVLCRVSKLTKRFVSWRGVGTLARQTARLLDEALQLQRCTTWQCRLAAVTLTLLAWSCSMANFRSLFAMVGIELPFADLCVIIAGLNLCGAVAGFSVAGMGVGETALAAILVALGFEPAEALSTALIVRPAALISLMVSSSLIALGSNLGERQMKISQPEV